MIEIQAEKEYTVKMSGQELVLMMSAVVKMPYESVSGLIAKVEAQAKEQAQKTTK